MKQSTSFTQVATNLLNVLQGYSKTIRLLLVTFLTLTVSAEVWGAEVTFLPNELTAVTSKDYSHTKENITIAVTASTVTAEEFRIFKNQTLTISTTNDNKITGVEITCTKENATKYGPGCFGDYDGYSYSSYVGTWSGSANSISLKASEDQVRATSIVITYSSASSGNPVDPYTVTLVPGSGSVTDTELEEESAGAGVTLPTPTLTGCDEWTFAGWKTTSAVTTETSTEPTLIAAGAYSPTSDITLYAVYQRTETTSGGGTGESHSITITPGTFTDKGSNSYGYGAERIGSENAVSFGGHYITGNIKNTPSGATAGTYLQCQANNATIYNKTELPGKITKIVVNQHDARVFSLYCGKEQLVASNNTNTGVTPSGTKITDISSAKTMTWNVSGDYTFFALKKGSNAGYITSIVITYQTDGGQSETTYYHSTPQCNTQPSR